MRLEIAAAERAYDLERAARLMYDTLPGLQGKLAEAEEELKFQVWQASGSRGQALSVPRLCQYSRV